MAIAKCTENGKNAPKFDIDLYSGFDDNPALALMIPDECWPDNGYDGQGVFKLHLKDLLEETLNEHIGFDAGEGTHKITSLLREYADKLDKSVNEHNSMNHTSLE